MFFIKMQGGCRQAVRPQDHRGRPRRHQQDCPRGHRGRTQAHQRRQRIRAGRRGAQGAELGPEGVQGCHARHERGHSPPLDARRAPQGHPRPRRDLPAQGRVHLQIPPGAMPLPSTLQFSPLDVLHAPLNVTVQLLASVLKHAACV